MVGDSQDTRRRRCDALNADEIALLEGAYVPRWPDDD
jgi:hypothetical protein